MGRRANLGGVGFALAAVGTALFVYGVMRVANAVGIFGLLLTVEGVVVAIGSAARRRGRNGSGIFALVAVLLLVFIAWVIWALATKTT